MVEVVGFDVRDDGGVRRQQEERAVALVGFGDEQLTGAVVRAGARLVQVPADDERRVGAAVLQRDGQHRRRRGLAVGAGDGDAAPIRHQRR